MSLSAPISQRKTTQDAQTDRLETMPAAPSVSILNATPEQISSILLPYMQATISHPSYEHPSRFMEPTVRIALKLVEEDSTVYDDIDASLSQGRTQKGPTRESLLALSLDLWALTQVIVSRPDDWSLSRTSSTIPPEDPQQLSEQAGLCGILEPKSPPSPSITIQLQAAAEQRASFISRNVMTELEKRLERREKCQGFGTFLVGILLLNCVERMSWALKSLSDSGQGENVRQICRIHRQEENPLTISSVAAR